MTPKPKKPPRQPKYRRLKRPHSRDTAFVELGGRRVPLGFYDTPESRTRYHQALAEWEANGRRLPQPAAAVPDLRVKELLAAFWKHAERHYRKSDGTPTSTLHNYRDALAAAKRLYAETPVAEFGTRQFKACRQAMIDAGWSRGTVNKHAGLLRACSKRVVERVRVVSKGEKGRVVRRSRAALGIRWHRSGGSSHGTEAIPK